MKKFFQYILIIILFSALGIILTNQNSFRKNFQKIKRQYIDKPCAKPMTYSIGAVDSRFNIDQVDFQNVIAQAEVVWENPMERDLFQYDPNSQFKVNLVYDSRQQETQEAKSMENQLNSLELTHDKITQQYNSLSAESKKKISDYDDALDDYKKKLDKYNEEVEYWNKKGGAPEDEYDKLKKEKKELDAAYSQLEKQRKEVNSLISKTNTLAQKSNQVAQNYNNNLNTYKDQFGEAREFDKGVYDGSSITIYQFSGTSDLKLVLVHELGHALGIDHLGQPESIMYYMMGEQDLENPKASDEDVSALKQICEIK